MYFGATVEEHNSNLHKVLRENGLTLNGNKCEFGKSSLEFYGYKFSDKGMEINPKKADKINAIQPPENPGELQSLLGMTNYCAKFIPDYATLTNHFADSLTRYKNGCGQKSRMTHSPNSKSYSSIHPH